MSDVAFTPRFGRVDPAILPDLPPPMRREAVLMTMERLRTIPDKTSSQCCNPEDERYIRHETQRVLGLRPIDLAEILTLTVLTPAPRASEDSDDGAPAALPVEVSRTVSGATIVFAQIRIAADPAGRLNVAEAFAAFRAFCAGRGHSPLPRAQFGAELLQLAKRVGGHRAGPSIHGLTMRGAAA